MATPTLIRQLSCAAKLILDAFKIVEVVPLIVPPQELDAIPSKMRSLNTLDKSSLKDMSLIVSVG